MILCCGEALIDMIPDPVTGGFVPHPGGAALNSAVALGRLDHPVGLIAGVSTDPFGGQLIAHMEANAVSERWAIRNEHPTTLAFVHLTDGDAQYSFYDRCTAGREVYPADIPSVPRETQALLFGGISLIHDPASAAFADLAKQQAGKRVIMLDPNIRPALVADGPDYRRRLQEIAACADIIKLSDEDVAWLGPDCALSGRSLTLITHAENGASAVLANGNRVDVPGRVVEVVDTVGAGDTFNAANLAWLRSQGWLDGAGLVGLTEPEIGQGLQFACEAASLSVTRPGACPPFASELAAKR